MEVKIEQDVNEGNIIRNTTACFPRQLFLREIGNDRPSRFRERPTNFFQNSALHFFAKKRHTLKVRN